MESYCDLHGIEAYGDVRTTEAKYRYTVTFVDDDGDTIVDECVDTIELPFSVAEDGSDDDIVECIRDSYKFRQNYTGEEEVKLVGEVTFWDKK